MRFSFSCAPTNSNVALLASALTLTSVFMSGCADSKDAASVDSGTSPEGGAATTDAATSDVDDSSGGGSSSNGSASDAGNRTTNVVEDGGDAGSSDGHDASADDASTNDGATHGTLETTSSNESASTDRTSTTSDNSDPGTNSDNESSWTDPTNATSDNESSSSDEGDAAVNDSAVDGGVELDGGDAGAPLHVATLQELTDESAPNYADNEHGLIAGSRLAEWLDDWQESRPAEIEGRLVILQIVPSGVTTQVHISADEDNDVYSYLVPANEFNVPRNSGFSAFETDIPDGPAADAWLEKYAIDPRKDFILITFEDQEATTNTVVHSVGRAWVFLKYWGVAKEHIGILNGSVNWNNVNESIPLTNAVDEDYSVPPENGTVSVRDLGVDATIASISLEEIIAILKEEGDAPALENVRIVDARGGAEALGLRKATSTGRTDCASYTGTAPNAKCSTPFEGRIKGARSVPWSQFLDSKANGFKFLPFNQVKDLFDEQANWDEEAEWSIQYCRTNQRSTVTGIVANVILGYPTRLYETSFIEWGHASTDPGILPDNSAYRTDLAALTEHAELHPNDLAAYTPGGTLGALTNAVTWVPGPNYNSANDVAPASVSPWPENAEGWPRIDPDATTTRLAIDTDRAYLRGIDIYALD